MWTYDYCAERHSVIVRAPLNIRLCPDPDTLDVLHRPRRLFPMECVYAVDGFGWEIPARLDVIDTLRTVLGEYPETVAFTQVAHSLRAEHTRAFELQRGDSSTAVPFLPTFEKHLKDYQTWAVNFTMEYRYVLLAMEQGTGKTLTSLYAAVALHTQRVVRRWLVLAPANAVLASRSAWQAECREAEIPYRLARSRADYYGECPFVLVGFEQLIEHLDSGEITLDQLGYLFDGIIVDESSRLGKPENRSYQIVEALRPGLNSLILLNGTPIENKLKELWCQVNLCQPGKLGTWKAFAHRHGIPDNGKPHRSVFESLLHHELVDTVFVAKLDLPPAKQRTIWVPLSAEQEEAYTRLADRLKHTGSPTERLKLYVQLQRVVNSLWLTDEGGTASSKEEQLRKLLPSLSAFGRKAILYSQCRPWTERLAQEYAHPGYGPLLYVGSMSESQRDDALARFKEGPEPFLWVTDAGVRSLNLQEGWFVVSLDLPWSVAVDQLVSRARRADTDHPVYWIRLLTDTPYERGKLELIDEKRDMLTGSIRDLPDLIRAGIINEEELLCRV